MLADSDPFQDLEDNKAEPSLTDMLAGDSGLTDLLS